MLQIQCFLCDMCAENAYIITDRATGRTAVIDPGTDNPVLTNALRRIPREQLQYILLTHGHFDHIGGAAALQREFDLPVICHELEATVVTDPYGNASAFFGIPLTVPKISQVVRDGDILSLGETTLHVLHTPGHTPGGVCYQTEDLLFSGDTLFCGSVGRTDLPGGSSSTLNTSLQRLSALKGEYVIYSGHGEPTTMSSERMHNPWLTGGF